MQAGRAVLHDIMKKAFKLVDLHALNMTRQHSCLRSACISFGSPLCTVEGHARKLRYDVHARETIPAVTPSSDHC